MWAALRRKALIWIYVRGRFFLDRLEKRLWSTDDR